MSVPATPKSSFRKGAAAQPAAAAAVARGWGGALPNGHMHPEDLAAIVAQVTGAMLAELRAYSQDASPASAAPNGDPASPADEKLTVAEVLAARPKLKQAWLYQNAADCGAVRPNKTKRGPLLFTLAGVDAALELTRVAPITKSVNKSSANSKPRGPRRRQGDLTPNGSPRRFDVGDRLTA
jgi:hypothetical protein